MSDLVRVPITPERFGTALYLIVLDLSKPSSVIPHLLHWTDQIKVSYTKEDEMCCCYYACVEYRLNTMIAEW